MRVFEDKEVPGHPRISCATPCDANMLQLLGQGFSQDGVVFTRGQAADLRRFYGNDAAVRQQMVDETVQAAAASKARALAEWEQKTGFRGPRPAMADPDPAGIASWMASGDDRDTLRRVRRDGLRLMGLLSRYLEVGVDPVKTMAQLLIDAGYDVDPEVVGWANGEDDAGE